MVTKRNQIERMQYTGGLIGLIAGSAKGKLQKKVDEKNAEGWNLAFIHADNPNLIIILIRILILLLTLGIWTIGSSELLVFEKPNN